MPPKKKSTGRRKRGKGWFSDAWDSVKKAGRSVFDEVRKQKLISTALKNSGLPPIVGDLASQAGVGRRRRKAPRRRMAARGLGLYGGSATNENVKAIVYG